MIASGAQSLIIECPHCATRYQLAPDALGPAGRKVQCANCGEAWRANPPPPGPPNPLLTAIESLVDEASEQIWDDALEREEQGAAEGDGPRTGITRRRWSAEAEKAERSLADIRAALGRGERAPRRAPAPAPAPQPPQSRALTARLAALNSQLPTARLRRGVRGFAIGLLVVIVGGLLFWRVDIVRQFPQMAGLYAAIGLPVNVAGLEFRDLTTELSRQDGSQVLRIAARIVSVAPRRVVVPPVVVSLIGADGATLYRWSVTPVGRDLAPGEFTNLSSQITTPPPGVSAVRLSFADGRSVGELRGQVAADTQESRLMARILVAEDDDGVRGFVVRALHHAGHEVTAAEDGGLAADIVADAGEGFDLLLSDIRMPVMDGIALAETVATLRPDLTILLMTGFADQRERADGVDRIVYDVIGKPFSLMQLVQKVEDALCGRPAEILPLAGQIA